MSARRPAKRRCTQYTRNDFEALLCDDDNLFREITNAKGDVAYLPKLNGPFNGYKATADHAKECTLIRFLLKAPKTSDVWDHPDARGLADELEKVRRRENPWPVVEGFTAYYATNQVARPVEGGFNFCEIRCEDGERLTISRDFISTTALSAVRAQLSDDPDTLDSVEGFAAFAQNASDGDVLVAKRARARAFNETLKAAAQMRNSRARRSRLAAYEDSRRQFWLDVGVTPEVISSIPGITHADQLDKFPELALLGNPDCPAYERCRELIFASQRRGNRGEADAFKNKVRKHLGPELIMEVLRARFPDLAAFPHIIEAMADRIHFDHIFSSACDHMMNLLIDFDTLNEHFGARRRLPDFATARARRRGIGREQRRASLASAI